MWLVRVDEVTSAGRLPDLPIDVPGLVGTESYTRGAWSQTDRT